MTTLLAVLLILLGIFLWIAAGLLPVLQLQRSGRDAAKVTLQLTWMGAFNLWEHAIDGVKGARAARVLDHPQQTRVELLTREGVVPLTRGYIQMLGSPKRLARGIHRFATDTHVPETSLPLRGRMSVMVGFALLFPLGTISLLVGMLMLQR